MAKATQIVYAPGGLALPEPDDANADTGKFLVVSGAEYGLTAFRVTDTAAPADGDIATSTLALWFDDTNGAAKLMLKGKSANGTVVTGSVNLT